MTATNQSIESPLSTTAATIGGQLELSGDRAITFRDHGQIFTFTFRRIKDADWKKFAAAAVAESATEGEEKVFTDDGQSAGVTFVDELIIGAEGYKVRGGQSFMELPNWKDRIPTGHKAHAASLLDSAGASPSLSNEFVIDAELDEVEIDAVWGVSKPGFMPKYCNLKHRFTPPKPEHQKRFFRAKSASRVVVGGDRKGRTIYGNNEPVLIDIYNELIAEVEGYTVSGKPLSGREQIASEMDAIHKIAAVRQLFASPTLE